MTMKTALITTLAATVAFGAAAAPAFADRVDKRQYKQAERIEHGIRNGTLTKREAKRLRNDQREISYLERLFRMDGFLSRKERNFLNEKQNQAGKRIFKLKHNDRYQQRRRHAFKTHNPYWYDMPKYWYMKQFQRDYFDKKAARYSD